MEEEVDVLVVALLWITQSWWPQLAHLIIDFSIKLPPTRKILYQPNKVRNEAKIWNRYNQVPNLTQKELTTETEVGGFSRIREVLQGRRIQEETADLVIQAWRQSTKKQCECYPRKWLRF